LNIKLIRSHGQTSSRIVASQFAPSSDQRTRADIIIEYLQEEWRSRKQAAFPKALDKKEVSVQQAFVPQQKNYWDCGIFLLHFAEQLLDIDDPSRKLTFMRIHAEPVLRFSKDVNKKREFLRNLLEKLKKEADDKTTGNITKESEFDEKVLGENEETWLPSDGSQAQLSQESTDSMETQPDKEANV
jgi:hypothetical protein